MSEGAHDAAERGHLATDQYGHALVEFDKEAESRLRWKIDLYVVPTVALMYLFCFIDRANIGKPKTLPGPLTGWTGTHANENFSAGNAKLAGFNKDLKLKGYDYNAVLSIFFVAYILFEIPSNVRHTLAYFQSCKNSANDTTINRSPASGLGPVGSYLLSR